ncbi:hypothetical protein [Desulfomonile tiedjei]|uniref:hypothetical protein n=1 Tax=Desulfomonile tiedjei TaxID=2358 RepID=UPI0003074692|nr:hypothetical protein [Desulfomonile tiedjei]
MNIMKNQQQETLEEKQLRRKMADLRKARARVAKSEKELKTRYKTILALVGEKAAELDDAVQTLEKLLENLSKHRSNEVDGSQVVVDVDKEVRDFNDFTVKLGEVFPDLSQFLPNSSSTSTQRL